MFIDNLAKRTKLPGSNTGYGVQEMNNTEQVKTQDNEQDLLKRLQANVNAQQAVLAKMKTEQQALIDSMSEEQKSKLVDSLENTSQELLQINGELANIQEKRKVEIDKVKSIYANRIEELKQRKIALKQTFKMLAVAGNVKVNGSSNGKWKLFINKDKSKLKIEYGTQNPLNLNSLIIDTADLKDKSKVKLLKAKLIQSWGISVKTVTSQFTNNMVVFNGEVATLRVQPIVVDEL